MQGSVHQETTPRSEAQTLESATNAQNQVHISPSIAVIATSTLPSTNTVPEFLYQLSKMLTDNNRDTIEWSNGKIEVHNPHKLQTNVLNRYFRHSKFASFQRQLNYFGFRKLAGKGKMAPCSYVNDATTREVGSLLTIKRKVGNEPKAKGTGAKKRDREETSKEEVGVTGAPGPSVNPVLANILYRSAGNETPKASRTSTSAQPNVHNPPNQSQQEIARVAVGRGIRHSFSHPNARMPTPLPPRPAPSTQVNSSGPTQPTRVAIPVVEDSLSALKNNFQSSLDAAQGQNAAKPDDTSGPMTYVPGSMRRDDSLVDLAMIPLVDEGNDEMDFFSSQAGLSFIDFPWQDPNQPSGG